MPAEELQRPAIRIAEKQLPGRRHPEPRRGGARFAHALRA